MKLKFLLIVFDFFLNISSQKPGTSVRMVGKRTVKRKCSSYSSHLSPPTGSLPCSMAHDLHSRTPRLPGYPPGIPHPPIKRSHRTSKTHQSSHLWVFLANSMISHTMNTRSQYIQGRIYNIINLIHPLIICRKCHRAIRRVRKERTVQSAIADLTVRSCRQKGRYLRGHSLVLWSDIEKCVGALRRILTVVGGEVPVKVTTMSIFRTTRSKSLSRRHRRLLPRHRNAILSHGKCRLMVMILSSLQEAPRYLYARF